MVQDAQTRCAVDGGEGICPWMFNQRMAISEKVKNSTPDCRVILFVDDENDEPLNEKCAARSARGLSTRFCSARCRKLFRLGYRQRVNKAENPLSRCSRRETVVYKTKINYFKRNQGGNTYGEYLCNLRSNHQCVSGSEAGGRKLSLPQNLLKEGADEIF